MEAPAGVLIIDKPLGLSSHDVVQRIRRVSGVRRVGHAGTLDPLATGVLVVCVGWATRLVEYLVDSHKTYETTVRLGQTTTTYDAEGEVIAERPVTVTAEEAAAVLDQFRGPIRQQAPAYSAIKRDGQPLYKKARRGEVLDLPVREVTIHTLELLAFDPPHLDLRVVCSAGTYIRSLAHDIGEALGCGGHVAALRRTASGRFVVADAVSLDDLTAATWGDHLLPPSTAVAHLPQIALDAAAIDRVRQGQAVAADGVLTDSTVAAAFDPEGCLVGIVEYRGGQLWPRKVLPVH